jgi:hypothetical protein
MVTFVKKALTKVRSEKAGSAGNEGARCAQNILLGAMRAVVYQDRPRRTVAVSDSPRNMRTMTTDNENDFEPLEDPAEVAHYREGFRGPRRCSSRR